jgi:hypothetical protein
VLTHADGAYFVGRAICSTRLNPIAPSSLCCCSPLGNVFHDFGRIVGAFERFADPAGAWWDGLAIIALAEYRNAYS